VLFIYVLYNGNVMKPLKGIVVGIDEVGRGSWAGPLVVGAVILKRPVIGLKDSKLLTRIQRERFDEIIRRKAFAIGLGWVQPSEIDALGLTASIRTAIRLALRQIRYEFDTIVIDGSFNFLADDLRARAIPKADAQIPAVSAASVIAKVARDRFMREIASQYPHYGFETHVGYGTAAHVAALQLHGACVLHRRSYRPVRAVIEASYAHPS